MKQLTIVPFFIFFAGIGCGQVNNTTRKAEPANPVSYACLPCGQDCDNEVFEQPGTCSHCHMKLVDKKTIVHKNTDPENLCHLVKNKVIFLDVRTAEEYNGTAPDKFGAIKNAINIPVQELEKRMAELEKYKDQPIVVYCSHSHRSPRASYILTQAGFKDVTNMNGGMSVWNERVKTTDCNSILYQQQ